MLGPEVGLTFQGWLDTRSVPFPGDPERTGDSVAEMVEAGIGPFWAVALEFQSEPDAALFGRLWRDKRPPGAASDRYQVGAVVVNLSGRGRSGRDMRAGPLRTCLEVVERNLADEDATVLLEAIAAGQVARGLLPWLALMRGADEAAIMTRWKALAEAEPDLGRRRSFAACARVFADKAGRLEGWTRLLEDWDMQESVVANEWRALGEAKGKAEGKAESILRLLELRFPPGATPDLAAKIRATSDLPLLRRWFDAAATVQTLEEFRALLLTTK